MPTHRNRQMLLGGLPRPSGKATSRGFSRGQDACSINGWSRYEDWGDERWWARDGKPAAPWQVVQRLRGMLTDESLVPLSRWQLCLVTRLIPSASRWSNQSENQIRGQQRRDCKRCPSLARDTSSTHKVLHTAAARCEALFAELWRHIWRPQHNREKFDFDPLLTLLEDIAQQITLDRLQLAGRSNMSRPNRKLPNLYELWKNICQTAIGWRIVQIGWRIVNLQKRSYSHL